MLYLLLAVFSSSLVALVLKLSAKKTNGTYGVYVFNYITCFATGFLFMQDKNLLHTPPMVVGFGAFSGFLFLASLALYQYNIKKNGTVLSAVFSKLGIIIPTVMSFLFFNETPRPLQIIGILLAIAAILVINVKKSDPSEKLSDKKNRTATAMQLLILLLVGGACDSMTKVFEFIGDRADDDRFMVFNFFFACVYSLFMLIREKKRITGWDVLFGVLLGVPNYFCTRFLLKALTMLPSFVIYPSYSVATVIVISLYGRLFFKEKLTKQQLIGVGIILLALVLLNL